MSKPRIAIVGLGFIGGSIGLALHQAEADFEIVGHDRERAAASQARKIGAVDKTDWNLISACEDADLIVIATPVGAIKDTLAAIAPYLKLGCLITDTASIKAPVVQWANEILPEEAHFVGGNPIVGGAGTTTADRPSGFPPAKRGGLRGGDAARADLFSGAVYCLTPAAGAAPDAVRLASDFVHSWAPSPTSLIPWSTMASWPALITCLSFYPLLCWASPPRAQPGGRCAGWPGAPSRTPPASSQLTQPPIAMPVSSTVKTFRTGLTPVWGSWLSSGRSSWPETPRSWSRSSRRRCWLARDG